MDGKIGINNEQDLGQKIPSSERPSAWVIASKFGGYSEVWMYRQAKLMRRLSLTVMTRDHQNPHAFPEDGFSIRQSPGRQSLFTTRVGGYLRKRLQSSNHRRRGGLPFPAPEQRWWDEQARHFRPSIALVHYGPIAITFGHFLRARSIPFVVHFHGYDLSRMVRHRWYCRRLKHVLAVAEGCVVVADYMRDNLLEMGLDETKVWKIPYGAPTDVVRVPQEPASPIIRFLAIGRLTEKKRPDLTIRAFGIVARELADVELVMVGDGPMLSACRSLAMKHGIADRVHFLGKLLPDDVRIELSEAHVFVQHSVTSTRGDMEGWPVAIAEAAAAGLPVISTRHASIPEQVEDGVSGLLCDEGDWEGMGRHMTRLASDEQLRQLMSAAARSRMSLFKVKNQVLELEQLLIDMRSDR